MVLEHGNVSAVGHSVFVVHRGGCCAWTFEPFDRDYLCRKGAIVSSSTLDHCVQVWEKKVFVRTIAILVFCSQTCSVRQV